MGNGDKSEMYLSRRLTGKSREIVFGLIGAVLFSLIVGIVANSVVTYFVVETRPFWLLIFFFVGIALTVVLFGLVYHLYALTPNSYVRKTTIVPIIYDVEKGEVIQDPFDGYVPQMMSSSTFLKFKKKFPKLADERIRVDYLSSTQGNGKHILTELMESVTLTHLCSELLWPGRVPLQNEPLKALPPDLEKNLFLQELGTDSRQLMILLPEGVQFKYLSPVPSDRLIDPNTFRFRLVSKQTEVSITVNLLQTKSTSPMKTGPAPVFEDLYIRSYWEAKLIERFQYLHRAAFHIEIEVRHKFTLGVFKNMPYIEWADGLIERFLTGGHFAGFDWQEFRQRKLESVIYDVYEEVRETNLLLKKLTDVDKAES